PQRHCEFSTLKEFNCATLIGRCQFTVDEQTSGRASEPFCKVVSERCDAVLVSTQAALDSRQAKFYKSRGPGRTSIIRLASATISSVLLFSRLTGLFGHGEVEPQSALRLVSSLLSNLAADRRRRIMLPK